MSNPNEILEKEKTNAEGVPQETPGGKNNKAAKKEAKATAKAAKKENKPADPARKKKRRKIVKRTIIAVVIIAVAAVVAYLVFFSQDPVAAGASSSYIDSTVLRGTIISSISGSGALEPNDSRSVASTVTGEILSDNFEDGDIVEKDQLLYTIDSSDMSDSIEKAEIALDRAQESYNDAVKAVNNLTVTSTETGLVTNVYVSVGDQINSGSTIADVVDTSSLLLTVPFNDEDASRLYSGQTAQVTLEASGVTLSGTVSRVGSGTYTSSLGALVRDVEIRVTNPGALQQGDSATASVGDIYCNDSGTIKYASETVIRAKSSGEVKSLNIKNGDYVYSGNTVAVLESDSVTSSLTSAQRSLREAELSLENSTSKMDEYEINASISGTVVTKNLSAGDVVSTANASSLATIYDMTQLVVTINVDELDISNVEVGQEVLVTADAFESETYTGIVDYVSVVGSASGGVTTFPVKIILKEYGNLLPGMNVNAEIILEEAEDTLMVPVGAIFRGDYVLLKTDDPSVADAEAGRMGETAPEGYVYVKVEVGLTSSDFVEIISGVKEGDTVAVNPTTMTTDSNTFFGMSGGMMGGSGNMVVVDGGGGGYSGGPMG